MVTINFYVNKQVITHDCPQRLVVAGSREFVYASFTLDEDWDGLTVTAVFENDFAAQPYSRVLSGDEPVEIPPEVLVTGKLRVSLVGVANGGDTVVPTALMRSNPIQVVQNGPLVGLSSSDVSPALWEQALAMMGDLSKLKTADKSSLVAAINEARQTGGGDGGGGFTFETDETLSLTDGVLSVNTADAAEKDNTLPITSAAVHTAVGNIEELLKTI